MVPLKLCNHWNEKFREMNPSHPNVSTGLASIIIAAHYYEPKSITLLGFDKLLDPSRPFEKHPDAHWSGPKGQSLHDWEKERKFLDLVQEAYRFELTE